MSLLVDRALELPLVSCDIAMIERVLTNLIENALRFTPPAGTVRVDLSPCGDSVRVSVTDTGAGIDPEDLPHIFDRFYRADKSRDRSAGRSRKATAPPYPVDSAPPYPVDSEYGVLAERVLPYGGAGVGLGLAIAREIVALHGSALEVESRPGEGARFSFHLWVRAIPAPA